MKVWLISDVKVNSQLPSPAGCTQVATFLLVSERPRRWEWTVGGHQLPLSVTLYDDDSGYMGEDAIPNR